MRFETNAIHIVQEPDPATGAVIVPVYQTSTFKQERIGKHKGYEYSRTANPTRTALEKVLACLEKANYGLVFSSGVAATSAVFSLLKKDDHIVSGDDLYGGTYRLLEKVYRKWGINTSYADVDSFDSFENKINKYTKLIWIETPTNPLLKIIDIQRLSKLARKKGILLAVDNTFASPYFQNPLSLGADIVVHSTTKYISGHSDLVGGVVLIKDPSLYQELKFYQNAVGSVPGPWDCWLVLRGLKTLAARMKSHQENALYLAKYLHKHAKIERVFYPGLPSFSGYKIAQKQMNGFSGMVSFQLKGGREEVDKFISGLKLFTLGESLGGVESLVSFPAAMTHSSMPAQERLERGITDNLIRLSIGIENKIDLKKDIEEALKYK